MTACWTTWAAVVLSLMWGSSEAASSGKVADCDPYSNTGWGCSGWKNPEVPTKDCLDCQKGSNKTCGHMEWVHAPTRTDEYTLRAERLGEVDRTSYIPGDLVDLTLRVKRRDYKYRGLLITAVDQRNATVGSWAIAGGNDALFWSPSTCPKSILHMSASVKPYTTSFTFRAPTAGTGKITFRCLIKRGPANNGYFHHPMLAGDLQLTEGSARSATMNFVSKSGVGESCDQHCQKKAAVCDEKALKDAAGTGPKLQALIGYRYLPTHRGPLARYMPCVCAQVPMQDAGSQVPLDRRALHYSRRRLLVQRQRQCHRRPVL